MITFFNPYPEFNPDIEADIMSAMGKIISDYKLAEEYVNIIFLKDDQLLKLNLDYLGHDYYTDMITFNYSETPKTLEAELYISLDRVRENAATNAVSLNEEMKRVIVHGMLHLAGFNDQTESEKKEMRLLENKYMKSSAFHVKQDKVKLEEEN